MLTFAKSMQKKLPQSCPSCSAQLHVRSMRCATCDTEVTGAYPLPLLASLSAEEQDFVLSFVKSSGSLKVMAQQMGLSYPTVRNILDDLIEKLNLLQAKENLQ
jgi:hypothetical protein